MDLELCPLCKGEGSVPTKCPRCFGSGRKEPTHTIIYTDFTEGKTLVSLDTIRNVVAVLNVGDSFRLENIYIGQVLSRQLRCSSTWYLSRWGKK